MECYSKFIYSEQAAKILRNLHLFLIDTSTSQKKVEISQKVCGLLRIYELYLSLVPKDRGKPKIYILSPNHDIVSYLTQTNNLGTTFYAIFMPSRSRSNCIFGLWVKSKILGSSHFALSESDLGLPLSEHFQEQRY